MPDEAVIGIVIILVALFGGMAGLGYLGGLLYARVNRLMSDVIKLKLQTEEERNRRREILTSSEMILGGNVPEYRATSADE